MDEVKDSVCPNCGSPIEIKNPGYLVCVYCGTVLLTDGNDLDECDLNE